MKVVITGGCGFLGQQTAEALLGKDRGGMLLGEQITAVVLVDKFAAPLVPALASNPLVSIVETNIADPTIWEGLIDEPGMSVFALAAVMSGEGEENFDLCMDVNLKAFMSLLERCRRLGETSGKVVHVTFSSTGAVFGPLALVTDETKSSPMTTYGMTKATCELLINDYSRRGFIDGRAARLATVIVRPGKPNAATTSCFSGVVREPLSGVDVVLPVSNTLQHAVASTRTTINSIVGLHEVPDAMIKDKLGQDRCINVPSFSATLGELTEATLRVVKEDNLMPVELLGKVFSDQPDERLNRIVSSMMSATDSSRALSLGLAPNPSMDEVIREYIRDFWSPSPPATVGFVGIGYMGSGMVKNLAKGGFKVAIANRTIAKAEAVAATLDGAATVFGTAGEVAAQASIISVCTASEASGEAVITELIAASKPGHILLDHSTVSPAFTAKMHAAAAAKGVVYLDAPISGGPEGAANGTLAIMVGGDEATFKTVLPVLQAMGSCIELMGPLGTGTATKLVNQLLVGAHAAAACEALQLGKQLGLTDLDKLLDVLGNSWGQSKILNRCGRLIADSEKKVDPSTLESSGAPLRNLVKDLDFVGSAVAGTGIDAPVVTAVQKQFATAIEQGKSEADMAVLFNMLSPSSK